MLKPHKLFILAARMVKDAPNGKESHLITGYRIRDSEDAAKGNFVSSIFEEKPNFCIEDLLCLQIPDEVIRVAYSMLPPEASAPVDDETPSAEPVEIDA